MAVKVADHKIKKNFGIEIVFFLSVLIFWFENNSTWSNKPDGVVSFGFINTKDLTSQFYNHFVIDIKRSFTDIYFI